MLFPQSPLLTALLALAAPPPQETVPQLQPGDTIALVGNGLAERMQHAGWFETYLHLLAPEANFTVRNLGFAGDELGVRQRTQGFGTPDEHLQHVGADVILAFFGFNESFRGERGLPEFRQNLAGYLDHLGTQLYNGEASPRVILVSPIPYSWFPTVQPLARFGQPPSSSSGFGEPSSSESRQLTEANLRLHAYSEAMREVAAEKGVPFLDAWSRMKATRPPTINGIHLDETGNRIFGEFLAKQLLGRASLPMNPLERTIHRTVLQKNLLWFNRHRTTDGYNVYGGRSGLRYTDDLANYDVMQRELEILDAMARNLDRAIWTALSDHEMEAVEIPAKIEVKTNRPGYGTESQPYLTGEEALARMTLPEGLEAQLFADEERFPEIANPVQMAFDPRGRLWVAAWPSYPHWEPGTPMDDRLVILEDEDGDGRADSSKIFARGLHNPTGFEFWNGGVFVAQQPDLTFLRDDNDDDVADSTQRILGAFSSADTHHAINSFVFGPGGALYMQEGTFHQSQLETPHGPVRSRNACVWRFDPRTWRAERYVAYNFANPHGHVFTEWGQDFVTDGTGNVNYYALPFSGWLPEPNKHAGYFPFFRQRSRPAAATEILSSAHFPESFQDNYLIANVIGFQGIFRYAVSGDGSGFRADELEPLVQSSDPNFRPVDIEVAPDGSVYFLDWQAPLIGHMQHHIRDPLRDHEHGRIYRITARGGELLESPALPDLTTPELVLLLSSDQARLRSRVRIELSSRPFREEWVEAYLDELAPEDPDHERHRLEALWLYQRNGKMPLPLLKELLRSPRHEARAAATRVVRQLRRELPQALDLLEVQIEDDHPRVRLEALVALSEFHELGDRATELALLVVNHPRDRFLDYALEETLRALDAAWRPALVKREGFLRSNPEGLALLLDKLTTEELAQAPPSRPVYEATLRRRGMSEAAYARAVHGLAHEAEKRPDQLLVEAIETADSASGAHVDHTLMTLFALLGENASRATRPAVERLRTEGKRSTTRKLAGATLLHLSSAAELDALMQAASKSSITMLDFLEALSLLDPERTGAAFRSWAGEGLKTELLRRMDAPRAGIDEKRLSGRYVRVELEGDARTLTLAEVQVFEAGVNVAPSGSCTQSSINWGGDAARAIDGNTSPRWGDGAQTHTMEGQPDPWWELDLGQERNIDEIVVFNRVEENNLALSSRLDGFRLRILDSKRRTAFEHKHGQAPMPDARIEVVPPDARLRSASAAALAHVLGEGAISPLLGRLGDEVQRASAVRGLSELDMQRVAAKERDALEAALLPLLTSDEERRFTSADDRALLALAGELADHLPAARALALRRALERLGPQAIVVRPVADSLLFDRKEFTVVAGRPVELVFDNTDIMPHNLVVTAVGALARVGLAAEAMALEADAWDRAYVPDLDEVLFATKLLQPGESQTLAFDAPASPGEYPFVCTFPGHWARMNGIMRVVASEQEREALEAAPPELDEARTTAVRTFVKAWKTSDLQGTLRRVPSASPERGLAILEEASCRRCHQVFGQGGLTGPPLEEAVARHELPQLLQHLLEPSLSVDDAYVTEILELEDGTFVVGRVVEEGDGLVLVQEDPYDSETVSEVLSEDIQERTRSWISAMPSGLLNTFEADEIADLLSLLETLRPNR